MKITVLALLTLSTLTTSCSHIKKSGFLGPLGDMYSEPESIDEVWKRFPNDVQMYALTGKQREELQVDKDLKAIFDNKTCFNSEGKKLGNTSFCEDVAKLVQKLKVVRNQVTKLQIQREGGRVSESLVECIEQLEFHTRYENLEQANMEEVYRCRSILSQHTPDLFKQADEIRKSPVSKALGLENFDAFTILNSNINESKARNAIAMSSKKQEALLRSNTAKDREDGFWSTYCTMKEAHKRADKMIAAEPNQYKRQKMKNDKEGMEEVLIKARETYKKKNGKSLDDSNCKKYIN